MKLSKLLATYFCLVLAMSNNVSIAVAAQTTSWDTNNEPQMFLDVSISNTQTTSIVLAAPQLNGNNWTFATTSGGVLRFRQGFRREDMSFTSASVNSSTKKITLSGVTRNICPQNATTMVSCGSGQYFSKGTVVELTVDAHLLNFKANKDRANVFTASGSLTFNGSGSLALPTFASATVANQQLGASPGGPVRVRCLTGPGTCSYYIGGQWINFGSGSTQNATESIAGKVQLTTLSALQNLTMTGSTNAPNVLTNQWVIKNGTGSASAGRIPITAANGALAISVGGTGTGSYTQSGILLGNHKLKFTQIQPGTANNVLTSDGTSWRSTAPTGGTVLMSSGTYVKIITANGTVAIPTNLYTFQANALAAGNQYAFDFFGTGGTLSATPNYQFKVKLNSTVICPSNGVNLLNFGWHIQGRISVQSTGGTGKIHAVCDFAMGTNGSSATGSTVTIDTTTSQILQMDSVSNGTTGYIYSTDYYLRRDK